MPTLLFCLLMQWLGLYVASFLLIAGFMRFIGRIALWKSLLTSVVFSAIMFVTFDVAFDVIMPKGPIEAAFGYFGQVAMEAFALLLHGFAVLLTWKILALMLVGLVLGIFVGVLPGLGGPNGVAILLPLTFTMDPTSAIVMLSCIYWGALFGGAITSILFNIPGEAWSVATTFDGYPMAQQGKAAEALTAAFTSSFIGSLVAVLLITFLAPRIASFALRFGPPEFFAVYLLTFCSFVGLGREDKHKTIISMALGLLLAGDRHGHRVGPAAHDLRLDPAAARRQFPGRGHRPVRHQRDPADHGGAARAARPRGADQPARRCSRCGGRCRATG